MEQVIRMHGSFGKNKVIERLSFQSKMLEYNTQISIPNNAEVVVIKDGEIERINKIDNFVINSHRTGFFNHDKFDPSDYVVYFVYKARIGGAWGGNVQFRDNSLNEIHGTLFIRVSYYYHIENGAALIQKLQDIIPYYSEEYLKKLIHPSLSNLIQQKVSSVINEVGLDELQNHLFDLSNHLLENINNAIFGQLGLHMDSLEIVCDEEELHRKKRSSYEWNKIVKENKED